MSEIKHRAKTQQEIEAARFNGKAHLDKVIPIRLSSEKWEEIKKEASELGLQGSVLARMWILDSLRRHKNGLKPERTKTKCSRRLIAGRRQQNGNQEENGERSYK